MLSRHFITSLCISLCFSVPPVLVFSGTYVTIIFLFFKSCFDCYFHYLHFVLTILSQTIISTPPPLSFLSLLQVLYPSSFKLTWISPLSLVSTMHIISSFFSFK
ncbi:hypothetical protein E2C01_049323 [Portunus trituberculatus]|uniref:Uncharacterized protein n=1 Tax=Portunus trituberculatus TaxID=210409 RepID=A0A5B7GCR6_PORTR|nr:hypothetical protein [Portunus trituberculatus]